MANARARSQSEALAIAALAVAEASDPRIINRRVIKSLIRQLPALQKRRWDERWGLNIQHADETIAARAQRPKGSYYKRTRKNARATESDPFFEWGGFLRQATAEPTRVRGLSVEIDPDKNYRGPIKTATPFRTIVEKRVPGDLLWDLPLLEQITEKLLEDHIKRTVADVARRTR